MANPRQRRKAKSGTAKVKSSRRQQSKLKRNKAGQGPAPFRDEWDEKKTVKQNFDSLGLLTSLNPRKSENFEPKVRVTRSKGKGTYGAASLEEAQRQLFSDAADAPPKAPSSRAVPQTNDDDSCILRKVLRFGERIERDEDGNVFSITFGPYLADPEEGEASPFGIAIPGDKEGLHRGMGRIERDAQGNAIGATLPEDEDDIDDEDMQLPWGPPMNDSASSSGDDEAQQDEPKQPEPSGSILSASNRGIPFEEKRKGRKTVEAKTEVVKQLEILSQQSAPPVARFASGGESDWLIDLISVHGEDFDRMAKDKRRNVFQRTAGQIRRSVAKAGRIDSLKLKLSAVPR